MGASNKTVCCMDSNNNDCAKLHWKTTLIERTINGATTNLFPWKSRDIEEPQNVCSVWSKTRIQTMAAIWSREIRTKSAITKQRYANRWQRSEQTILAPNPFVLPMQLPNCQRNKKQEKDSGDSKKKNTETANSDRAEQSLDYFHRQFSSGYYTRAEFLWYSILFKEIFGFYEKIYTYITTVDQEIQRFNRDLVFTGRLIWICNKNMPKMECKRKLKVNQNKKRQKSRNDMR